MLQALGEVLGEHMTPTSGRPQSVELGEQNEPDT